MSRATRVFALVTLTFSLSSVLAATDAFLVVVNSTNPISMLHRKELSSIFLKKTLKWPSGLSIEPIDQGVSSAVRHEFSTSIHHKSGAALRSYWWQQIFSGRDVPPPEKATDADVIAYVKANRLAIGYVSAGTATEGVKIVRVVDR